MENKENAVFYIHVIALYEQEKMEKLCDPV